MAEATATHLIPRDETREQKAQRLVRTDCVSELCDLGTMASALVQGDHGLYNTITFSDGIFICECEWGRYNSRTRDRCSHALAVALATGEDIS